MTDYKLKMRLNHRVTPEIKYMHLMEAIEEAQLNFLIAREKGETFTLSCIGQSKFNSKKWKKERI